MLNQARLKVLKVREDHVRDVLDDTRRHLGEITKDPTRYKKVLQTLIVQALFQVHNFKHNNCVTGSKEET